MDNLKEIKVKTFINSREICPGKYIDGICRVKGVDLNKKLHNIVIYIKTIYIKEGSTKTEKKKIVIQKKQVNLDKGVKEGSLIEIPFKFKLNNQSPVSIHKSYIWIKTCLKANYITQSEEKYYIDIVPPKYMENIIFAIEKSGFNLAEVENRHVEDKNNNLPFIQYFKFNKVDYKGINNKDEFVKVYFNPKDEFVEVYFNQDKKLLFEYKYTNDLNYLTNKIYSVIKF